eukprot:jgi/Tetstr1/444954/TSEL_032772.t1
MKCSAQVKSKNSNNSADSDWQLLHDIMPAGFTWSLKLTAAWVWYVMSVADIIKGWFRDPVWSNWHPVALIGPPEPPHLAGQNTVREQMGVIGHIEEDLAKSDLDGDEDGELSPAARRAFNTTRLAEAKQNTGYHGVCQVHVVLGFVSMVNLFPLAPCHMFFFGLGKDF